MNPAILLSLIHDLQARILQLSDLVAKHEETIKKLEADISKDNLTKASGV